jgi:hypothetical protein
MTENNTPSALPVYPTEAHQGAEDWMMEAMALPCPVSMTLDQWAAITGILEGAASDYDEDASEHIMRMVADIERQVNTFMEARFPE